MRNRQTIIIDCNYLGHASRFAVDKKLKTSSGIQTNVIYGFLQSLITLAHSFDTNKFVFVWDSKKSKRREIYPEYKASRHKDLTKEEEEELKSAFTQFKIIRKRILPAMGFTNNFLVSGYEGDDLIASIIFNDKFGREFLIYASDHDLYQLLSCNVSIIKKKEIYTIKKFVEEYGINPSQWWQVKAIAGCNSDEVAGIRGVGESTACKYLRNELKEGSIIYKRIADEKESFIRKNTDLVRLPFPETPPCEIGEDKFDIKATQKLFQYYEFDSFLEEFDEWEEMMK